MTPPPARPRPPASLSLGGGGRPAGDQSREAMPREVPTLLHGPIKRGGSAGGLHPLVPPRTNHKDKNALQRPMRKRNERMAQPPPDPIRASRQASTPSPRRPIRKAKAVCVPSPLQPRGGQSGELEKLGPPLPVRVGAALPAAGPRGGGDGR